GGFIRPGDRVFIKPNLVTHEFRRSCGREGDLDAVVTHPAVVRAVADYAAKALRGRGEIVIGDNPSIDCDFDRLDKALGLTALGAAVAARTGLTVRVLDLRPLRTDRLEDYGLRSRTTMQDGDPEGSDVL